MQIENNGGTRYILYNPPSSIKFRILYQIDVVIASRRIFLLITNLIESNNIEKKHFANRNIKLKNKL